MASQPINDIDAALKNMQDLAKGGGAESRSVRRSSSKDSGKGKSRTSKQKRRVNPIAWLVRSLAAILLFVSLPFLVLVRLSMHLHTAEELNIWVSILISMGATTLLLLFYAAFLRKKISGTWSLGGKMAQVILAIVVVYCGYSLMYLSMNNVKTPSVATSYHDLHPALRLATSTLILVNRDLVVTDMARTPEDYAAMGLPVQEYSSHFKGPLGYVEAVDLRTKGKPEWTNLLVHGYFRLMGFHVLRHEGTADHLHVYIKR